MCIFFFTFYGISPCGGCQTGKKELSNIHCPIHTITAYNTGLRQRQARVIGDKPSGADLPPSLHITPLRKSLRLVKLPPDKYCAIHSYLARYLSVLGCLGPFFLTFHSHHLSNLSSVSPFFSHLSLLIHTLLTNLSFPIPSTCPNTQNTNTHTQTYTHTFR